MDRAWKTLVEIGAVDNDERLTALGKHMVSGQKYVFYAEIELWSSLCYHWMSDLPRSDGYFLSAVQEMTTICTDAYSRYGIQMSWANCHGGRPAIHEAIVPEPPRKS